MAKQADSNARQPVGKKVMPECLHGVPLDTECEKCAVIEPHGGPGGNEGKAHMGRATPPSGPFTDDDFLAFHLSSRDFKQPQTDGLVERLRDHGAEPSYRVWERALFIEAAARIAGLEHNAGNLREDMKTIVRLKARIAELEGALREIELINDSCNAHYSPAIDDLIARAVLKETS
jgi:hypothetical protein